MTLPVNPTTWEHYQALVLYRLEQLDDRTEKAEGKLSVIHNDVLSLKIKSGLWGAGAGIIVSAITSALIAKFIP